MEELFRQLVNLSISAGWLVLAVIVARLVFRRAPRWMFCLLWGLVALRLVCPISLESPLSLIPSAQTLPPDILYTAAPQIHSGLAAVNSMVNPALESALAPAAGASANPTQIWAFLLSRVWLAGAAAMVMYALASYVLLRRRLASATLLGENIKESERVDSPFVLGLFRPTIYLPYSMAEGDREQVIAHERAHIRRGDHWWKPLGFALLAVYWFHPLMWVAYGLFCRDLETACDERVIRDMAREDRRAYSTALLHCSIRRRFSPGPLAFGEVGVKERMRRVMHYKKPAFWVVAMALVACGAAAVCFLTDPVTSSAPAPVSAPSPAGKVYVYEGEGFGSGFGIRFWADGNYTYYEGLLSSYIGMGEWSMEGDILTLTDQTGVEPPIVNRFRVEGDDLVFLAEGSRNFIYVKVPEGARFRGTALEKFYSYDTAYGDIDRDGREEQLCLGLGSTSGLFTFNMSAYEENVLEYQGVYCTQWYDLSFVREDGTLGVQGVTQEGETHFFDIQVEEGRLLLVGEDGIPLPGYGIE